MLDYKKGLCIAKHFRGILLEILKRTQSWVRENIESKKLNHVKFSLTLSHLLPMFPYILSFVLKYFQENGPFFCQGMQSEEYTLVVETAYRFLSFSPATFRGLWNWGILRQVNYSESDETKWFFVKAISIVLNCNNIEIIELFKIYDSSTISQKKLLDELCYHVKTVAETQNENDVLNEIVFTENDLCEEHMITGNMLIPRISKSSLSSQQLVAVPSMLRNVEALSVAFVSGKAVLVAGAVGSGKTSLVEHFATLTGRDKPPYLFKVQLGDQTDSKVMLLRNSEVGFLSIEVIIGEYSPRRSRGEYFPIITEPESNNCFSIFN
jgi:midasin